MLKLSHEVHIQLQGNAKKLITLGFYFIKIVFKIMTGFQALRN